MTHKLAVLGFVLIEAIVFITSVSSEDLVIIVNSNNSTVSLSKQECKNIFLGKKSTWNNGSPIIFVEPKPNSDLKQSFNTNFLDMPTADVQKYWVRETVRGNIPLPQTLGSATEIVDFISTNGNAIGYCDKADLQTSDKVKVVAIN